jgi:protein-tyrosine phosphatase
LNIINAAGDYCIHETDNEFRVKSYNIRDNQHENIECIFYECFEFIEDSLKNGGKVLVHCAYGVSRSVTIVSAYLIWKLGLDY